MGVTVEPTSLFVYGTLLDDACVRRVTGRTFPRRAASLPGHRRVWPAGGHPYLVADPAGAVAGAVLDGLDASALAALDAYEEEGSLYVRETVTVVVGGAPVPCWIYRALGARS
jgi:gamma-glutamylcyclotransferase (GGCT)/AIG2-like uncharacterized protein YtfP